MNVIINIIKWYCLKTNNGYTSKLRNVQRKPFIKIYKKHKRLEEPSMFSNVFGCKPKWE